VLAGAATLAWAVSFVLYWVQKGTRPFDYVGFFLIGCVLIGLHFFLLWDWNYSWHRRQP
jgi:hypothetical protein